MEEICEDNNCIVRAFENNPISILKEQDGNRKKYYFKASDIGKVLDIVNIRTSIINFDEDEKVVRTTYSSNSGNPDTIFLSSQGVYRLLYNSKKPIAKKFRKWAGAILDDIIFNESKELKRQLQEKEKLLIEKDLEFINQSKIEKHNFLLDKFSYKRCIYVMEVEKDKIKIGSTGDINSRKNNLKDVFGVCLFVDVFECEYYREVEQNILVALRKHLYKEKINGHFSKEIILLTDQFNYAQLVRIVKEEIKKHNQYMEELQSISYYKNKISELQTCIVEKQLIIQKLLHEKLNDKQLTEIFNVVQPITPIQTPSVQKEQVEIVAKGRQIQEIDPDNLDVIKKIYKSMIYALRENSGYEKHAIQKAIKNNTIYKGSRWLYVEHHQNPNIVNNISPTVDSSQPEQKCIVKINKERTKITECFTGITQLRKKYKMGDVKINYIINNNTLFDNGYFKKMTDCPPELLKDVELPRMVSKKAKSIKQTNINTKQEKIYKSLNDLYIKMGISSKKLEDIIKNKQIFRESNWQYI